MLIVLCVDIPLHISVQRVEMPAAPIPTTTRAPISAQNEVHATLDESAIIDIHPRRIELPKQVSESKSCED
jgi:hypothetical protein